MITRIKNILLKLDVDNWKIFEITNESKELFFIRKELDMNRTKKVNYYTVTVFKNYTKEGQKYTGSATIKLASSMDEMEMSSKLEKGAFAATFVQNPYYPMVKGSDTVQSELTSQFSEEEIMPYMTGLKESLYKNDLQQNGGINSAEIFINKYKCRLITSACIDVTFNQYKGEIELITEWKEGDEAVELYNMISFSDYCPELIEEEAKKQLENTKNRALAKQAINIKDINIILSTDAVKEMMGFYLTHSSARAKYEEIATAKVGELFQGEGTTGDLVNMELNPFMKNSPDSALYDNDGVALGRHTLYENGVLKKYHGSVQFASYLDIEPTGSIHNIEVKGGAIPYGDLKKDPYIEILTFSDFQMDNMTGDFGGEIRLAIYFDGKNEIPITGASLSANLFEVQKEFYLSKEITQKGSYMGPKALMYKNGSISGE